MIPVSMKRLDLQITTTATIQEASLNLFLKSCFSLRQIYSGDSVLAFELLEYRAN